MNKLRPLAIYLPQFHPIPENDKAWGKGFTEWTNVKKTKPLFSGHYQPHIPHKDVGYYDLRDKNVLVKQAQMAKNYGIEGFAFYHYWFNGKRLLNQPIDNMLNSQTPNFPFCLTWANENWTRRWDGADNEVIIKQNYSNQDDIEHINFLCKNVFPDKRYILVNQKPLFIIYKPELFPDIKKTTETFRNVAKKHNFEIYLCYFENGTRNQDPKLLGFDAAIEFQPKWSLLPPRINGTLLQRALNKFKLKKSIYANNYISDYSQISEIMMADYNKKINYKKFPSVVPMWDNSARRKGNATLFRNSSPEKYALWLKNAVENFEPYSKDENFIFINAWNEWAEGNHIEPCQKWGYKYLEMTKNILNPE